jgi:hypothetical protein
MLEFIKRQPDVIKRLLSRIESSQFAELVYYLMRLHDRPGCGDVLEVSVHSSTKQVSSK